MNTMLNYDQYSNFSNEARDILRREAHYRKFTYDETARLFREGILPSSVEFSGRSEVSGFNASLNRPINGPLKGMNIRDGVISVEMEVNGLYEVWSSLLKDIEDLKPIIDELHAGWPEETSRLYYAYEMYRGAQEAYTSKAYNGAYIVCLIVNDWGRTVMYRPETSSAAEAIAAVEPGAWRYALLHEQECKLRLLDDERGMVVGEIVPDKDDPENCRVTGFFEDGERFSRSVHEFWNTEVLVDWLLHQMPHCYPSLH